MNHRKHKDIALARRVEAERQAAQTPMLGWSTTGPQADYVAELALRKAIAKKTAEIAPTLAQHYAGLGGQGVSRAPTEDEVKAAIAAGHLVEYLYQGVWHPISDPCDTQCRRRTDINTYRITKPADIITPEQLRAAFVNAGVDLVEHKDTTNGEWGHALPAWQWSYIGGPHHYRPVLGTPPEVLTAFYRQWDAVEADQTTGSGWMRVRVSEETRLGNNAAVYRLPADAKLIRPLPAKE